jgi:methylglutaconyl-CoA hydratase
MVDIQRAGAVATVLLNRPEAHNALNTELMIRLTQAFNELHYDETVRIVVLTGAGSSFCAGGDVKMMQIAAESDFEQNLAGAHEIFDCMDTINHFPKPVVGRVQGSALGGGVGLVSCCDVVVAAEKAKFGLTEVRLGIVPAVISPYVIAKIGVSNARQLFLTGERFSAHYAQQIGLVHHVVADEGELDAKIQERVQELLQASPHAQAVAKRLIRTVAHKPILEMREFTAQTIAECRASADGQEGMSSFLEKRKPRWQTN